MTNLLALRSRAEVAEPLSCRPHTCAESPPRSDLRGRRLRPIVLAIPSVLGTIAASLAVVSTARAESTAGSSPSLEHPVVTAATSPAFGLEGRLGPSLRLGMPAGLPIAERAGLRYGLGLWWQPSAVTRLGLSLEQAELGRERSSSSWPTVTLEREVRSAWLELRLLPFRTKSVRPFLSFGPGLLVQRASASGLVAPAQPSQSAFAYRCEGSASPRMGLRIAAGSEWPLTDRLAASLSGALDGLPLSSDSLDDCTLGVGSTTAASAAFSLSYRFSGTPLDASDRD